MSSNGTNLERNLDNGDHTKYEPKQCHPNGNCHKEEHGYACNCHPKHSYGHSDQYNKHECNKYVKPQNYTSDNCNKHSCHKRKCCKCSSYHPGKECKDKCHKTCKKTCKKTCTTESDELFAYILMIVGISLAAIVAVAIIIFAIAHIISLFV